MYDPLDDAFPLGEGTADTEASVLCPWCGEPLDLALDPGGGSLQEYVEDCGICCRPVDVRVQYQFDGHADVEVSAADQ